MNPFANLYRIPQTIFNEVNIVWNIVELEMNKQWLILCKKNALTITIN